MCKYSLLREICQETANTGDRAEGKIAIVVETDEEKQLSNRELKTECFLYARGRFQGKSYKNTDTGREILVSRDGLDEWYNKTKSRDQALSIKNLDKLLENGKKIDWLEDNYQRRNVEGFVYLSAACCINGNQYDAIISIKQTKNNKDKFYHYYLRK